MGYFQLEWKMFSSYSSTGFRQNRQTYHDVCILWARIQPTLDPYAEASL